MSNSANIFDAIGLGVTEIIIQAEADFVPVEQIGVAACREQSPFQRVRNRGFSGSGKAREPEACWLLELLFRASVLVEIHLRLAPTVAERRASERFAGHG